MTQIWMSPLYQLRSILLVAATIIMRLELNIKKQMLIFGLVYQPQNLPQNIYISIACFCNHVTLVIKGMVILFAALSARTQQKTSKKRGAFVRKIIVFLCKYVKIKHKHERIS